jgi:hypothetical protein
VQPFDFLPARRAAERRIDEGDLDGPTADRLECAVLRGRARDRESRRYRDAQLLEL